MARPPAAQKDTLPLLCSADADGFIFIWDPNADDPTEPLHAVEAGDQVLCLHVAYFGDEASNGEKGSSSSTELDEMDASDFDDDLADASFSVRARVCF